MHLTLICGHGSSEEQRIDPRLVPAQTPMKMRACRSARCAYRADPFPLAHGLPQLHIDAGKMKEGAAKAMTMVDHQQIALQREWALSGEDHYAICGSKYGASRRSSDVDAAMIGARHALIDALRSEKAGNTADAWP